ncbi:MAG: flagellar hook basal-body protein [Candidatus Eremiobacteraeota bacterium]|nr:flagellar hook basal-body protein [Candidatus Eremiobacteraeota bacterium]
MSAAQSRLEIAAHNLANASSNGFRRSAATGSIAGTGVRISSVQTADQGALHRTGRPFDLALVGEGAFVLRDPNGVSAHFRGGSFVRDRLGHLRDDSGRVLEGVNGPVRVPQGATIESDGSIREEGKTVDRIALPQGATVRTGFIEMSNVNAISEMVDVLSAQRSFESAQKVLTAIDGARAKSSDEVARLK